MFYKLLLVEMGHLIGELGLIGSEKNEILKA